VPKLVDAFRIARRQLPDLWLVLAGDDPKGRAPALGSRDELEAEHVRVTGYVSEQMLTCLLSWTKAFVFPSLYEGFGFPILEAMANGAPVITSRVASLPEIGDDAVVYIDPNDPQGIADAIVSVCTNRDVQKRLRERGLRQATKFRWQETADQTFEAYQEAVHHGRDQSL
jgi:glycosyltransferase involved in cell wall biosynthesis